MADSVASCPLIAALRPTNAVYVQGEGGEKEGGMRRGEWVQEAVEVREAVAWGGSTAQGVHCRSHITTRHIIFTTKTHTPANHKPTLFCSSAL